MKRCVKFHFATKFSSIFLLHGKYSLGKVINEAINRPPVADRSPTGRRFLGIVVADQSPIDLQPKNAVFDRTVVALVAAVF